MEPTQDTQRPSSRHTQLDEYRVALNWENLVGLAPKCLVEILTYYCNSTVRGSDFILGLAEAPAGKGIHHEYLGGLVEHLLEGIRYLNMLHKEFPSTNYDDMLLAWYLHDLHKGYFHYIQSESGTISYLDHIATKHYTPNQKTMLILNGGLDNAGPTMVVPANVLHILNCSEGGWAESPPKESSVEAKIVYLVDELSVVNNRIAQGRPFSIYNRSEDWFKVD